MEKAQEPGRRRLLQHTLVHDNGGSQLIDIGGGGSVEAVPLSPGEEKLHNTAPFEKQNLSLTVRDATFISSLYFQHQYNRV